LKTTKSAVFAEGTFLSQNLRFDPLDEAFIALAAVDRNCSPGKYPAEITIVNDDGSRESFVQYFEISDKRFDIQQLSVDPRYVTLSKEDLEWVRRDNVAAAQAYAGSSATRLWNEAFIMPVEGPWSAPFGVRRMFNGEERSYHSGADIAVSSGTAIYAANKGRVVLVRHMFFGGKTVIIDHGQNVFTGYMHLSEFRVKDGQNVERGDLIGLSGSTGRVTGPHLHWMLRINNIKVNAAGLLGILLYQR
jgi:murein DD-endopeptidase MepM/ murein hydrolase activator NlpD